MATRSRTIHYTSLRTPLGRAAQRRRASTVPGVRARRILLASTLLVGSAVATPADVPRPALSICEKRFIA
jgi:hypothetical protein